jgi:hypothetical protein
MGGGYGVLPFFAGTSSNERVEWVGHEGLAMQHYGMDDEGLE